MGTSFQLYLTLLFVSGLAIGIFETAALALISDITNSTQEHTRTMNALEGFFGIGAIVGPLLVISLHARGVSWTYLYLFAAALCLVMIVWSAFTDYPETKKSTDEPIKFSQSFALMKNKYAMGFSMAIALYVAAEVSIFVWLPSYLDGYTGAAARDMDGELRGDGILYLSRRRTVFRRLDTQTCKVDNRDDGVLRCYICLFCRQRFLRANRRRVPNAIIRPVYVDDVPDAKFQGH